MVDKALVAWLVEEWILEVDSSEIRLGEILCRLLVCGKATRSGLEGPHRDITFVLLP